MRPIQATLAITIDNDSITPMFELLVRAIEQGTVQCRPATPKEPPKELLPDAKPQTPVPEESRLAQFSGKEPTDDRGLLIDEKEVARLLKVSPRTVWRLKDGGRMPKPVRIGNAVRWSLEEIKAWIEQGCPSHRTVRRR